MNIRPTPSYTPPKNRKPDPPPHRNREMLGAAVGGLALALPSVKLGIAAGQAYGPEIAHNLVRRSLIGLSNGDISARAASRTIQWATDPLVQARVGGLAIGTLGILVGAGLGYLAVRAFSEQ